ncbi:FAD binding domain-containing protein [Paenibacillus harenae]|uniref:FAD binding domain-containing protein n=1 Tax=Paenibacillus harenae TaxID=306543 RepID=UPI00278FC25C|nr:FAD binding domain-containing protein [Paenibacillus harenae]MDQ0059817.1 carbon-monoxide dehydrogenase medium subunit [Paenibacillus harenae]
MGTNAHEQETIQSPLVWHPQSAADAWQLKQNFGADAVYAAGGTLLRTQWESGLAKMPAHLIDVSRINGQEEPIREHESGMTIDAATSLAACRSDALIARKLPLLAEAVKQIAAPSVRQLATLGGNVSSLVGDSLPALLVYDAQLHLFGGAGEHWEELSDWLAATEQALLSSQPASRLLIGITIPMPEGTTDSHAVAPAQEELVSKTKRFGAYYKVGRREAFTPSVVAAAVVGSINSSGVLEHMKLAVGGGQTIPRRLKELEAAFAGSELHAATLQRIYDGVLDVYEPRGDLFASADYRKSTAANLIVTELWKSAAEAVTGGW